VNSIGEERKRFPAKRKRGGAQQGRKSTRGGKERRAEKSRGQAHRSERKKRLPVRGEEKDKRKAEGTGDDRSGAGERVKTSPRDGEINDGRRKTEKGVMKGRTRCLNIVNLGKKMGAQNVTLGESGAGIKKKKGGGTGSLRIPRRTKDCKGSKKKKGKRGRRGAQEGKTLSILHSRERKITRDLKQIPPEEKDNK